MKIYVASKTNFAEMWKTYRANGFPIISTWIDEAGPGETKDLSELWERIESEVSRSTYLVAFGDTGYGPLKGTYIEIGIALRSGIPVYASNFETSSWQRHPLVTMFNTVDDAMRELKRKAGA